MRCSEKSLLNPLVLLLIPLALHVNDKIQSIAVKRSGLQLEVLPMPVYLLSRGALGANYGKLMFLGK